MGRPVEPQLITHVILEFENIILACLWFFIFSMT